MKFDEDGTPIYLQLAKRVKADVMAGTLSAGERLPSVREAAELYRVNPNTMQRVMAELERKGIVRSERGVGFFVTDDPRLVSRLKADEADRTVTRCLADLRALGLTTTDAEALIHRFLRGDQP